MKVTVKNDKVYVKAYYDADFVDAARKLGGKWSAPCWVFDVRDIDDVRNICKRYYGTDTDNCEKVTLVVHDYSGEAVRRSLTLYGIPVIRAWERDSGAKPCDNVVILDGDIGSGGSRKNWYTYAYHVSMKVKDVPAALTETNEDLAKAIADGTVVVIKQNAEDDLQKRIDTIDEQIASLTRERAELMAAKGRQ